jgi:hypothetical protein
VAVANALPALKDRADWVTNGARGEGVAELIDRLLQDDLAFLQPRLERHRLRLGLAGGEAVCLEPYGRNLLVAGPAGSGKAEIAGAILGQLAERGYQCVVVDPDGDFAPPESAVALGDAAQAPAQAAIVQLVDHPGRSVVVNLRAVPRDDRAGVVDGLLRAIQRPRRETGRPHWLALLGAEQLLPAAREGNAAKRLAGLGGTILVTAEPQAVSAAALRAADAVLATGRGGRDTLAAISRALGEPLPMVPKDPTGGEAVWWDRRARKGPVWLRMDNAASEAAGPRTGGS